jgi:F-type H+-transporting ATPase subunit delta
MVRNPAAERYAKALFELAEEDNNKDEVRKELRILTDAIDYDPGLRSVLLEPLHPAAERKAVLESLSRKLGSGNALRNFYGFLIDQRRLVDIVAIREAYDRIADRQIGITQVELRTASTLSESQLADLREALMECTGGQVELSVEIDPRLLGGIVAKVGDVLFDGSVKSQLSQMRASLLAE